jgi:DDB1- and CUL4-associated factor 11
VLVGHTEGITYVTAKGDGRYVASNGKDQALRLWDLRAMRSNTDFERHDNRDYGTGFDYRYGHYPRPKHPKHPNDCSVMTYRGHAVLNTLIRCHFSPAETTGGQYLYTGSADGRIHIYSLDGTIVQVLDRSRVLGMSFDPSGPEPPESARPDRVCVRDVSWHSRRPMLMSVGWEGNRFGGSIVASHEWKGLGKLGGPQTLEDWVTKNKEEEQERSHSVGKHQIPDQGRAMRVPGGLDLEG